MSKNCIVEGCTDPAQNLYFCPAHDTQTVFIKRLWVRIAELTRACDANALLLKERLEDLDVSKRPHIILSSPSFIAESRDNMWLEALDSKTRGAMSPAGADFEVALFALKVGEAVRSKPDVPVDTVIKELQ